MIAVNNCGQARQRLFHIQFIEADRFHLKQSAEVHCLVQIGAAGVQAFQLAGHSLSQRALSLQHLPDLGQRHIQFAQQLDAPQTLDIRLRVTAVAVAGLPSGADEPLFLIKADILFGHAHGGFHLVDLHWLCSLLTGTILHLPERGRSMVF